MKRGLWILAAALLAGFTGFYVTRSQCDCSSMAQTATHESHSRLPELEWLRQEFKLTDAQFGKVSELHLAYRPICEALCAKVMDSHAHVKKFVEAGTQVSPDLKAALQEHAALHVECQTAMLTHLYQTSAYMSPDQARHYLESMVPQVIEMSLEPETMHPGH